MRRSKILIVLMPTTLAAFWLWQGPQAAAEQEAPAAFRNNGCVTCHEKLAEPLKVSSRFFDWHNSKHQERGVSCEKCHGGDPTAQDAGRAHVGVLRAAMTQSRLNFKNLPETCGSCHKEVVRTFVQSEHYQQLKGSGLGPTCTNCHQHMATKVVYEPLETANLCATCHNSVNGLLTPRPELPEKAGEAMHALRRAGAVVEWADFLQAQGKRRGLPLDAERDELQAIHEQLKDARLSWHEFHLDAARQRADAVFARAVKVKDALNRKVSYP